MILSSKTLKLILLILTVSFVEALLTQSLWAQNPARKDCIGCMPETAPGSPIASNKSLGTLVKVANARVEDTEDFTYYLSAFCTNFEQLEGTYDFKKKLTEPMKKSSFPVDKYWQESGCQMKRVGTISPIVHLAVENAADRKAFLEALRKYYVNEKKDNTGWVKAINAKNTKGQTVLDYIEYLREKNLFIQEEKAAVNELISFLCDNGATFSAYNTKKCPMSI